MPSFLPTADRATPLTTCIAFITALSTLSATAKDTHLTLAKQSESRYQIVIPANAGDAEREAAKELQRFLHLSTGALLPVTTDEYPVAEREIVLGNGRRLRWLGVGVDIDDPESDGFVIRTHGNHLIIAGNTPVGTRNGVFTFLEDHVGCRWYSSEVSQVPKHRTLRIGPIDDTQIPALAWREVYYSDAMDPDFARRNKLNGNGSVIKDGKMVRERHHGWGLWCHTFFALCHPDQYFENHPEYFSLVDGKRVLDKQLCLTNPGLLELAKNDLRRRMAEKPDALYWSVSQNDWHGNCECPNCIALDEREGTPMGSLLAFVNDIAREFPDKMISPLAYQYSRRPPKNIRPEKNVAILLCNIESNRSRPLKTDPDGASFREDVESWSAICDHLMVYDYVIQFSNLIGPFPNLRVLQPNIQYFADHNAIGIFEQGNRERGGEFAELRAYLLSRLLWNPDCDVEAVIDDFLEGYYGPAAPWIREYIDQMHDAQEESGAGLSIFGAPKQHAETYLTPEWVREYDRLFDRAERSVRKNPEVLLRVQTARLPVMYVQLELEYGNLEERRQVADRFFEVAEKTGLLMIDEWRVTTELYRERITESLRN